MEWEANFCYIVEKEILIGPENRIRLQKLGELTGG